MKIEFKREVEMNFVSELNNGECFIRRIHREEAQPSTYMKIEPLEGKRFNAVDLQNGSLVEIKANDYVIRVKVVSTVSIP
jgi:hypothetical protein